MKKITIIFFALFIILLAGLYSCDMISNLDETITTAQKKENISKPEDLGLGGSWVIWFSHSSACDIAIKYAHTIDKARCIVIIKFNTLIERFWLDIPPDGAVANRTWNSKSNNGTALPSTFTQYCTSSCSPPYIDDGRLWEWSHYWWPFIFPSADRLSGTVSGLMFKHPYYYLSWEIRYKRATLDGLYFFRGKLSLENDKAIKFYGKQIRRDPMMIIGVPNSYYHSKNVFLDKDGKMIEKEEYK